MGAVLGHFWDMKLLREEPERSTGHLCLGEHVLSTELLLPWVANTQHTSSLTGKPVRGAELLCFWRASTQHRAPCVGAWHAGGVQELFWDIEFTSSKSILGLGDQHATQGSRHGRPIRITELLCFGAPVRRIELLCFGVQPVGANLDNFLGLKIPCWRASWS